MIRFPLGKVHNAYILETYNYDRVKQDIKKFAEQNGFESNLVESDSHPDIVYLESPDKKIAIDDVRNDILTFAYYSPKIAERKFYVIYDAVNLDINTQNAMLKTLEEPASFTTFFLVTSNSERLLSTVRSRCQILKDTEDKDYKKILGLEYLNDALFLLADIKNAKESDIFSFADNFDGRDDRFKELIMIYRYVLRDALIYKRTLAKDLINLREKENEIIDISNALGYEELGKLIDNLNRLSELVNMQVNKKIAVYNFFNLV